MKKSLIALAVLAASGAAFAQSSVTLYGYGDMGVGKSVGTAQANQFNPGTADVGGIRWGMRGSEDLGGGLKATFGMETNAINEAGVGDGGFGRGAFFGLSGAFGTVQLGRQARNSVVAGAVGSPAGWRGTDPESAVGIRYSINNNVGVSSRQSALVNYISPSISGFSARVGVEAAADNAGKSVTDIALLYSNGPLALSYGYIKAQTLEANSGVHGSYDFGVAKVYASYNKRGAITGAGAVAAQDGYSLGVKAPFGATTVYGTFAKNNDTNVTAFELGADYALSKRTALTAFVAGKKDNDMGYYVGVRHSF
jgi:predicted porin